MAEPDINAMAQFCKDVIPGMLHEACNVEMNQAEAIAADILRRAESFAALNRDTQRMLSAPFLEEVISYDPPGASLELKATVTVVVRNSQLEVAHAHGPVNAGGIKGLTSYAAGPLSHLISARRNQPQPPLGSNPFLDLPSTYPRAAAALSAIAQSVSADGGRVGYHVPDARVPDMPAADKAVEVKQSTRNERAVVQSAVDESLSVHLVEGLQNVIEHQMPMYVPTLSRLSRNMDRLLYVIELLLAHEVPIITTNYLLRSSDVWIRKGQLLPPDNYDDIELGLKNLDGLSGSHRKMVEAVRAGLHQDQT